MPLSRQELEHRLEEAAEARRVLRRATVEMQSVRKQVIEMRADPHGPERSHDPRTAGR